MIKEESIDIDDSQESPPLEYGTEDSNNPITEGEKVRKSYLDIRDYFLERTS